VVSFDDKFIGPFFFEAPAVTGEIFLSMVEKTTLCHVSVGTLLQLDGAPPHFCLVRAFLDREFPDRWPPRSPDLTPLDFLFWGL
jgi:hypothetical protein